MKFLAVKNEVSVGQKWSFGWSKMKFQLVKNEVSVGQKWSFTEAYND